MAIKYEIKAKVGEYQDGNQTKSRYLKIGVVMTTSNGGFMVKLDAIPTGWDGVAFLNEPEQRNQRGGGGNRQQQNSNRAPANNGGNDGFDDDIPF